MDYDMTALHKNMYNADLCCTQIMFKTGLDLEDDENEAAVKAAGGLCGGLKKRNHVCGILTGTAMMINYLVEDKDEAKEIIIELVEWFDEITTARHGGADCHYIVTDDRSTCQTLMEETYQKAMQLLEDKGYEYE